MGDDAGVNHTVLLVEDDARIRAVMRMSLEEEGYRVREAENGEQALQSFAAQPCDIVLVDLMLPGMSGFDVCRTLRQGSGVPILVVSARADTHDVVAGLEAGADDYVTKPFVAKELAARMRAPPPRELERRPRRDVTSSVPSRSSRMPARFDGTGTRSRSRRPSSGCCASWQVMRARSLSREQLLDRVWGYDYLGDGRLVDAHIRRLRTKIEVDPSDPKIVVTIRGLGYRMPRP